MDEQVINDRINVEQFLLTQSLNEMQQAGFKTYVSKTWMHPEEWTLLLQGYQSRQV